MLDGHFKPPEMTQGVEPEYEPAWPYVLMAIVFVVVVLAVIGGSLWLLFA